MSILENLTDEARWEIQNLMDVHGMSEEEAYETYKESTSLEDDGSGFIEALAQLRQSHSVDAKEVPDNAGDVGLNLNNDNGAIDVVTR